MSKEAFHPEKVDAGRRLAQLREALNMTQDQFAAALGIDSRRLSGWELGRNAPDILILGKHAQMLGYTVDWVARGAMVGMDEGVRNLLLDVLRTWSTRDKPARGRPRKPRPSAMEETPPAPPRPTYRNGMH
jgi:transcriptional regulator with XRE-family HTH domain